MMCTRVCNHLVYIYVGTVPPSPTSVSESINQRHEAVDEAGQKLHIIFCNQCFGCVIVVCYIITVPVQPSPSLVSELEKDHEPEAVDGAG